jgi:hypothetical protein
MEGMTKIKRAKKDQKKVTTKKMRMEGKRIRNDNIRMQGNQDR